jgi:Xaa-Pro aminopeptidase
MRIVGVIFALAMAAVQGWGVGPAAKPEFRERRAELRKKLNGTLVLFGRTEGRDETFRANQEPNFYYLSGVSEPGAILLLTKSDETLFLPARNERREIYVGHRTAPEDKDARTVTGFEAVLPVEKFESALARAIEGGEGVFTLTERPDSSRLKQLVPFRDLRDAAPMIAALRVKKSASETDLITRATDVTVNAQRAAWKKVQPGIYEYQAVAVFTAALLDQGCEGYAYSPIFGSGPNGTVLHYDANARRMDAGEVMVIDAAAQCGGYTTDVTRTVPVSGKFTPRQRELYEIVLGAQNAAIAAIKPGVAMSELTKIARDYINSHGKDLKGNTLGKYLPHGVSHHVGLEVHDPGPQTIAPGMILTVEPGIYIPEENIGIRIEDTVLVTENGAKILSAGLPREPDEVEKAMAR